MQLLIQRPTLPAQSEGTPSSIQAPTGAAKSSTASNASTPSVDVAMLSTNVVNRQPKVLGKVDGRLLAPALTLASELGNASPVVEVADRLLVDVYVNGGLSANASELTAMGMQVTGTAPMSDFGIVEGWVTFGARICDLSASLHSGGHRGGAWHPELRTENAVHECRWRNVPG